MQIPIVVLYFLFSNFCKYWFVCKFVRNQNDNLSISYNTNDAQDYNVGTAGGAEYEESSKAINAAYALGGASARVVWSKADNVGGVLDVKDENLELSLALAF